jgi:hypothetical protein
MEAQRYLPDRNRLSVMIATILLAYALTRFVVIPTQTLSFNLLGIILTFDVNFHTIVSVLVAVMAATGSDWILRGHPALANSHQSWQSMLHHWILPALTAWMIGIPLNILSGGPIWWITMGLGGVLLVLVLISEYNVVDSADIYQPLATLGLTALSFALYLILAISLWSTGFRLYLLLPALVLAAGLVCLRTLYLRTGGRWLVVWSAVIALVVGQVATGLHYWPISPVKFGLLILAPTYALTSLAGSAEEGRTLQGMWVEPLVMLSVVVGLAIWVVK